MIYLGEVAAKLVEVTPVRPNPCVYLSGGIDSSVTLHCLRQKFSGHIDAYTAMFGNDDDDKKELDRARRIAELYNCRWTAVPVGPVIERLGELLQHFDRPRYNLWPVYLAEQASRDQCQSAYIGEGGDEMFGYGDRSYHEGWAGHLEWVVPTYETLNRLGGMETVMPFRNLPWQHMLDLWHPKKKYLRAAFRGLIPDWILDKPATPPRFTLYQRTWANEFPGLPVPSDAEIKVEFQRLATEAWLKTRTPVVQEA